MRSEAGGNASSGVLMGRIVMTKGQPTGAPVQIDTGWISGIGTDVRCYRGIPFARPPVGELRWRPPEPPDAWTGVRDCSCFGFDPVQPPEYPELRGNGTSEDCLTVNVWTPARSNSKKLPVLVWIYGGAYTYGSGSHPSYDGERLARRGIVVVTVNYRLGLLGFMAHPELSAESPDGSSGNYALMDQIAALEWVRRNIEAFGGDPARITAAGQSAGALSISSLMVSPRARGLFQQAILQSVGVMRPMCSLPQAEAFGMQVGPNLRELRRMEASALVDGLKSVQPFVREMTSPRALGVIVDGSVLPEADADLYRRGAHERIPMLVGSNADEGAGMAKNLPIATKAAFEAYLDRNFVGDESRARAAYPIATDADVRPALHRLVADAQYLYGTREMLRIVSASSSRVYRYVFDQRRNGGAAAPIHGDELQYVFDNLDASHRGRQRPSDAADSTLAREMADAWVRFVASGDPNGGDLPAWPAYDPRDERYLTLGKDPSVRTLGAQPALDMIRDYYDRKRYA